MKPEDEIHVRLIRLVALIDDLCRNFPQTEDAQFVAKQLRRSSTSALTHFLEALEVKKEMESSGDGQEGETGDPKSETIH